MIDIEIREIWSVSDERIKDYFLAQGDVRQDEVSSFSCGPCKICLALLPPREVGRFRFPQTRVTFSGPDEETAAIHRRFVLQFISAGG